MYLHDDKSEDTLSREVSNNAKKVTRHKTKQKLKIGATH